MGPLSDALSYFVLKYGIKKKEEIKPEPEEDMGPAGLNRRKKTPEEIAAENEAAEQDELTSKWTHLPSKFVSSDKLSFTASMGIVS